MIGSNFFLNRLSILVGDIVELSQAELDKSTMVDTPDGLKNQARISDLTLVKKIDVFSTEKNGEKRRKMALFRVLTLALNVGSWAVQG